MEVDSHEDDLPTVSNLLTRINRRPTTNAADPIFTVALEFMEHNQSIKIVFNFSSPAISPAYVVEEMLDDSLQSDIITVNFSPHKVEIIGIINRLVGERGNGTIIDVEFRLSHVGVERLKKVKYDETQSQECYEEKTCAICLNDFVDGVEITKLTCLHIFHGDCLGRWLKKNASCPLCRLDVNVGCNRLGF